MNKTKLMNKKWQNPMPRHCSNNEKYEFDYADLNKEASIGNHLNKKGYAKGQIEDYFVMLDRQTRGQH